MDFTLTARNIDLYSWSTGTSFVAGFAFLSLFTFVSCLTSRAWFSFCTLKCILLLLLLLALKRADILLGHQLHPSHFFRAYPVSEIQN